MNPAVPSVSVVIATSERHDELEACLRSVEATRYPAAEIVVVENGPSDRAAAELAAAHGARYVYEPQRGLSRARNAGVRAATGDVVAFIDDDAVADPGWLEALVKGFADEQTLVVTGRILPIELRSHAQRIYSDLGGLDAGERPLSIDRSTPLWFEMANFGGIGYGGNMAFARRAFDVWPGFRESLGLSAPLHGTEEQHAFFSIVRQGFRIVYRPDAIVRHPYPAAMASLRKRHVKDLERVAGYAALLFVEAPEHRRDVARFLVGGVLRRPRLWKRVGRRGRLTALVSLPQMAAAAVRGVRLYGEVRRFESAIRLRGNGPPAEHPAVLMLGKGWFPEQLGGLDRYFRDLFEHLPEARALVVGPVPGNPDRVVAASRHAAFLPLRFLALWRAARLARRGVDVIDAHFALYGLAPIVLGPLRSLPAVVHFQGPWADENVAAGDDSFVHRAIRRAIERLVYRRARRIVVLTSAFRRILVEGYGVSPWCVRVVPPGVDLERFTPGDRASARQRLKLEPDAFVAVAVRRLVPRMGLDVLVEAWLLARDDLPGGARLLIVGQGPEREALEALVKRHGASGSIELVGSVEDDTLVDIYRAADVGIVPTRSFEGFGLVVIEAAACGTPSIVTNVGGLPEAVRELDPTLAVPADDAAALARRIMSAARPGGAPSRANCRRFAEGFSWQAAAERNRAVLREALAPEPASRRTRVVYLDHVAQLSGGEIALLRLLPHLRDVDAHVILAEDGPLADRLVQAGISTEVLSMRRSARDLRKDSVSPRRLPVSAVAGTVRYVLRLAIRLRRLQPDLVHTNSLKAGLYGSLAARLAGIPVVWHVRDRIAEDYLPPAAVRLIRAMTKRFADVAVANSHATLATIGRRNALVVCDVLPDVRASPGIAAARESTACTFGMVGRIAAWKGQDLFLRAFARAFPEGSERAVIIGAPMFAEQDVEDALRQMARDLKIDERVDFRGFREDVWSELQGLDVLVHASTTPEPFGLVVIEGMAAGLPVIAPDEGGPAEIVDDGRTGRLFRARDADSLAGILVELRDSPRQRARLGAAARAASEHYAGDKVAAVMQDLYEDVLGMIDRAPEADHDRFAD